MSVPSGGHDGSSRTVLAVRELSKTFTGQRALDRVDFDLAAGEVHALLGQNGCGKSTLIKCLAGYYDPDPGSAVVVDGRPLPSGYQPADAAALGLVFVHQDLGLIPNLTVAENFAISRRFDRSPLGRIGWRELHARASKHLQALGHDIDPRTVISRLSVAERTVVAIARALASAEDNARVLVLDEPTAALPDARRGRGADSRTEVELLFDAVRKVVAAGVGVIYVSHKLEEVLDLADRATVLRDGRNVATVAVPGMAERDLVHLIVGHEVAPVRPPAAPLAQADTRPVLEACGISGRLLRDVSFALRPGEVVGVAGMLGSGRSELARILFGAQPAAAGTLAVDGRQVRFRDPVDAVRAGIALIPENRREHGGMLTLSVAHNLSLTAIRQFFRRGRITPAAVRSHVESLIHGYHIQPHDPARRFGVLSGGNQQKVVIAKWMATAPKVVIFDEPVQGVDVEARAEIYELISRAAQRGAAIVLITSELEHLLQLCTRALILRNGRLVADLPTVSLDRAALTHHVYFGAADAPARPVPRVPEEISR